MHEFGLRTMLPQLIAYLRLGAERVHHPISTLFGQPAADRLQPGMPVVIVEGDAGLHLAFWRAGESHRVGKRHARPLASPAPTVDLPEPDTPITTRMVIASLSFSRSTRPYAG